MNKQGRKIDEYSTSLINIHIPTEGNKILTQVVENINNNREIKTLWKIININAIDRLGFSDHGPTHFGIVANNGLRLLKILEKNKVTLSIVRDFGLTNDYAEVVVFLACIMHDLGMSIHREGHEEFSLFLAKPLLEEVLRELPIEERVVVVSETLHAIISHRSSGKPYTVEAGIVRIADALDMGKGRSRISYKRGEINIFSLSDLAINKVEILEGINKPIEIKILLENPAGIFQVDDLMKQKLKGSGLEKYIEVSVYMLANNSETLFKSYDF